MKNKSIIELQKLIYGGQPEIMGVVVFDALFQV